MTKISACISPYNGDKHIKEQLESILTQLNGDAEVIISDDSSTDDTLGKPGFVSESYPNQSVQRLLHGLQEKHPVKGSSFSKNIMMHDFWIALIAALFFKVKFIYEPLILHRRHSANLSFTVKRPLIHFI